MMHPILRNIVMLFVGCCSMCLQGQEVEAFVNKMLEQYPQARLLDIYKSCFQDQMGAEHLVSDQVSARDYLEQELATIAVDELMPWYYEPCGVDGNHVRVSLRVVIDGIMTTDELMKAFVGSANTCDRPTVEQWAKRWHEIIGIIDGMNLDLAEYEQDKQFIEQVLSQGKYAISHSPNYRDAYSPHYRIVERRIFEQNIMPLLPHE